MNERRARIVATGSYLPERVVENAQLERELGLESGWIKLRTGIVSRRFAKDDQAVSDLALSAGRSALQRVSKSVQEGIGTLILATSTPDHLLPPTAPRIAHELGLKNLAAFDMAVACSGFVYALSVADSLCRTDGKGVMVIAANVLSRRLNSKDVATSVVFADAAGAVLVGLADDASCIMDTELDSDGSGWEHLLIPDGGSRNPFNQLTLAEERHLMQINNGMSVFRYAVESMAETGQRILKRNGLAPSDIDLWIPHQANFRIIESARKRLGFSEAQTFMTLENYGNSSAATIPVTLDQYLQAGNELTGKICLFTTAAAGLTSGALLVRM